jgi:hypothetical protein
MTRGVVAVVFHELDQRVDRLPPEVVGAAGQRIGLIQGNENTPVSADQRPQATGLAIAADRQGSYTGEHLARIAAK